MWPATPGKSLGHPGVLWPCSWRRAGKPRRRCRLRTLIWRAERLPARLTNSWWWQPAFDSRGWIVTGLEAGRATARHANGASSLLRRHKRHTDGGERFQDVAGGSQFPCLGVDTEDHYVIRIVMGGEQIGARGVDREIARRLAARGRPLHRRQRSLVSVDGEDADAVRPARRTVDELAVGMHGDLGAADVGREIEIGRAPV